MDCYRWMRPWHIVKRRRWQRVDDTVECFELRLAVKPWSRSVRMVIYRKKVAHETRKNFQLDLFDPDDGHYEYSAVATNKSVTGHTLWFFMCGRDKHEKVCGELKSGYAFGCVPTQKYEANSAWQAVSIIAFNLMRRFQAITTAGQCRSRNRKRRALRRFELIHALRYRFLNRAGLMINPNGGTTLEVGDNAMVRERFRSIHHKLATA